MLGSRPRQRIAATVTRAKSMLLFGLASLLLCVLLSASPAAAGPGEIGWQATQSLAGPLPAAPSRLSDAVAPNGDAAVIWNEEQHVVVHVRRADGSQVVKRLTQNSDSTSAPSVVPDGEGGFVALWSGPNPATAGQDELLFFATLPAGSTAWSDPQPVGPGVVENYRELRGQFDAAGNLVVASATSAGRIRVAIKRSGAASFDQSVTVLDKSGAQLSELALSGGLAYVYFIDPQNGLEVRSVPLEGRPGPIVPASPPGVGVTGAAVTPVSNGNAAIALEQPVGSGFQVWTERFNPNDGRASGVRQLSPQGGQPDNGAGNGRIETIYTTSPPAGQPHAIQSFIELPVFVAGAVPSVVGTTTVSGGGENFNGHPFAAGGDTLFVWDHFAGTGASGVIQGRQLRGRRLSPVANLSSTRGSAVSARLGGDAQGNVFAAWLFRGPTGFFVRLRGGDFSGPRLQAAVPRTAQVGHRIRVSATAADLFSAVRSLSVGFGDGTTIASAARSRRSRRGSFRHTYRRASAFTVTVRSKDSLGHSSTLRRRISVR